MSGSSNSDHDEKPLQNDVHHDQQHAGASSSQSNHHADRVRSGRRVGKYILERTLGQGTFGKVKLGIHIDTKTKVALKMMIKSRIRANDMGEQLKKEITIMRELNHPNVVRLIEVLASPDVIYLVLELASGGELLDRIMQDGKLEEDEAREYFKQLISGLSYCHDKGVCHRDLKPENLLLDENGILKISDFGLSAQQTLYDSNNAALTTGDSLTVTPAALLHTTCGTPTYVAPEVLLERGYDGKAADIWSAGVIAYVLLAGFPPFDEGTTVDLFRKIVQGEFSFPKWFSRNACSLLSRILQPDPAKRATMKEIKEHPWMKEGPTITSEHLTSSLTATFPPSIPSSPMTSDSIFSAIDSNPPHSKGINREMYNGNQGASDNEILLSMDAEEEEEEAANENRSSGTGAVKINAFDLINMVGGAAMNRMFSRGKRGGGRTTQFTSSDSSEILMQKAILALKKMPSVTYRDYPKYCQIRALRNTPKGKVYLLLQIFEMTPSLYLVECRKMKGDIFLYWQMYREMKYKMGFSNEDESSHGNSGYGSGSGSWTRGNSTVGSREESKVNKEDDDDDEKNSIHPSLLTYTNGTNHSNSGAGGGHKGRLSITVTAATAPSNERTVGSSNIEGDNKLLVDTSDLYDHTPNEKSSANRTPDRVDGGRLSIGGDTNQR